MMVGQTQWKTKVVMEWHGIVKNVANNMMETMVIETKNIILSGIRDAVWMEKLLEIVAKYFRKEIM